MAERPIDDALLPHRGPARLVEAVLDAGPDVLVCRGRVPADNAFARSGRVPAVVALELAAQAAAVQQAFAEGGADTAKPGYLVGIRSASLDVDEIATDVPLVATVRRTGQAGPLGAFEVSVTRPDKKIATAILSTHSGD